MCNTMRVVQQIRRVPEYVPLRLDSSGLASVREAFKGPFITPRWAGKETVSDSFTFIGKMTRLISEVRIHHLRKESFENSLE